MKNGTNILYIGDYLVLFIGRIEDNETHKHFAHQISFNPKKQFLFKDALGSKQIENGIVIKSNHSHSVNTGPDDISVVLLIEPESALGEELESKYLSGTKAKEFSTGTGFPEVALTDKSSAPSIVESILSKMNLKNLNKPAENIDPRLSGLMKKMPEIYKEQIKISEIASMVSLSESRFQHLFKEQISISFKQYLIWYKIKKAVKFILSDGNSLTQAAYESGFADAPHFSRTFRYFFGLSPSQILK